jgi:ABC-type lipopolysaccharide export system ATPase subunit
MSTATAEADRGSETGAVDPVIDVHGLDKSFGDKHVVVDLSLKVGRGEIFGFLGPNGSGKTTSIRLMCGLLTPDAGSGTCLGYDIRTQSPAIKRNVGYMTQRFSFWEDLTIRENLEFVARIYSMADRKATVDRALSDLGLASRAGQLTGTLSGDGSSGSRSPRACCTSRGCCCSTSRPPGSTRTRDGSSGKSCTVSRRRAFPFS